MPITPVIDHAVINVDDKLDSALALFQKMGFQLSERGHHSMGSSNHLAVFADNYLELLGYQPTSGSASRGLWQVAPGLAGLVWKTQDAHAAWTHLQACGLDGPAPTAFSRPVTLPDGTVTEARFCISRLRTSALDYGFSFFCEQQTPDAVWQPAWQVHPNSTVSLSEFIIASSNPAETTHLYRQLFNTSFRQDRQGSYLMESGSSCLRIITPEQAYYEFAIPTSETDTSAKMVALCFKVRSMSQLKQCLTEGEVLWQEQEGHVLVTQQNAHWLTIRFQQQ